MKRIATFDRTGGSCQSVALAYAGNKAGFDVKDFRGGNSYEVMSRTRTILDIANLHGVDSTVIKSYNDFEAVTSLLKKCKAGKEYILSTGGHTAVIRKAEKGYEFLELQAAYGNGYWKLTNSVLKERFRCKKSHSSYGVKLEVSSVLIDIETLIENQDFVKILGYINR